MQAEKIQQQVMEQRQQESKTKTPEEYAKDLEQWLKKMKCTGVMCVYYGEIFSKKQLFKSYLPLLANFFEFWRLLITA